MTLTPAYPLIGLAVYLLLLFLIACATDRGWIPPRIHRHPGVYALSLGVYMSAGTYYGNIGFAQSHGYAFLALYLGLTLAFLLQPLLLAPILKLTQDYRLSSLADLFAFRYRSRATGVLVTLFMLAGSLPFIALEIDAVVESVAVLTGREEPGELALLFSLALVLFSILFGARHISSRHRHAGLVMAMAFGSALKLVALLAVGVFAIFGVFDGPSGLDEWLATYPSALQELYSPVHEGPWLMLLLLSLAAAFLLPRQFHMMFTENPGERALPVASWLFPLFLLLSTLPVPVILWAGLKMSPGVSPDYYMLAVPALGNSALLPTLAFVGGVAAASAFVIVTTLAVSTMCLNHLLLPITLKHRDAPPNNLYQHLLWGRRMLISVIVIAGYGFYHLMLRDQDLIQLVIVSDAAVAQLLPGIIGLLFWSRATTYGFLAGLCGGATIWAASLVPPLIVPPEMLGGAIDLPSLSGTGIQDLWSSAGFWSLAVNAVLFVGVSLLTRHGVEERQAAHICSKDMVAPPSGVVRASTVAEFREGLTPALGLKAAEEVTSEALSELEMTIDETRPAELRRLHDRIGRNVSGLVGPALAHTIMQDCLSLDLNVQSALADDVRFIEEGLDNDQLHLRGLAAELDALRRYHRQVLQELPLGVCAFGANDEVVTWNRAMESKSGLSKRNAMGTHVGLLPEPWCDLLSDFVRDSNTRRYMQTLRIHGETRWFNLRKAAIQMPAAQSEAFDQTQPAEDRAFGGMVILVEEITESRKLEAQLAHADRLASLGCLAAGVAHEIGNPLTGIACLAQNLQEETQDPIVEENTGEILMQAERIKTIVQALSHFSHAGSPEGQVGTRFNVAGCVDDAMRLVRLSRAARGVSFSNTSQSDLRIYGDRLRFLQVFVNLLTNAADASSLGDEVLVTTRSDGDAAYIEVIDQGTGIDDEVRNRLFEPFFTTKRPGEGTGLGLSIAYSIVKDHGGDINIDSTQGSGTRVRIKIPWPSGPPTRRSVKILA